MEETGGNILVETNSILAVSLSIENDIDLPQEELSWSTVSLSEVMTQNYRLEASVYDLEGKHAREVLSNCKWEVISLGGELGLVESSHRKRFKRVWVEKSQYPIYQPSQITELSPKPNAYLSEITNTDINSLRVKKGQILLTCSGSIGNVTLVGETLNDAIFSHDLIRIDSKNPHDTGYVYAFLQTKIGKVLVNTNNYGAVISHIEPEHLENVPIPNPPNVIKKEINELILKSFDLRDESNVLLKEARNMLISELSLPPIEEMINSDKGLKTFEVKLSELDYRFESSYHSQTATEIENHLEKNADEVLLVGDRRISDNVFLPGRFKRVYVSEGQGTVFFGGKQIYELDPTAKKFLSTNLHGKKIDEQLKMKENMVLITRSGTIGKTTLVPRHWSNWAINEHVIRVIPASKDIAGYLYAFLSTEYGELLIKRFTYGAVVDEIDDNHVSQVKIPILKNKEIQLLINNMVLLANEKRYEAYKLEQKAIAIVNSKVIHSGIL